TRRFAPFCGRRAEMDQTANVKSTGRGMLLLRGESAVAFIGIAVAAILLGAMAASGWWTLRTQRQMAQSARLAELRAVGTALAQSGEIMLGSNELSALRRFINDASANYNLTTCRIVLPGGQIVADAEPAHINLSKLPETWADPSGQATQAITADRVELSY